VKYLFLRSVKHSQKGAAIFKKSVSFLKLTEIRKGRNKHLLLEKEEEGETVESFTRGTRSFSFGLLSLYPEEKKYHYGEKGGKRHDSPREEG